METTTMRQPSVDELEQLVGEWMDRAVGCLWMGDFDQAAAFFTAACGVSIKLDIDAVSDGVKLGTWDFSQLGDWVDEAKASVRRRRFTAC